jgi:hypothetical protein
MTTNACSLPGFQVRRAARFRGCSRRQGRTVVGERRRQTSAAANARRHYFRIRCSNITPSHVNHFVRLATGDTPVEWRNIAKDGVVLPPEQVLITKEALSLAVSETPDFEYRPTSAGSLQIEVRLPDGRLTPKAHAATLPPQHTFSPPNAPRRGTRQRCLARRSFRDVKIREDFSVAPDSVVSCGDVLARRS